MVMALSILISPSRLKQDIEESVYDKTDQQNSQSYLPNDAFNEAAILNSQFQVDQTEVKEDLSED